RRGRCSVSVCLLAGAPLSGVKCPPTQRRGGPRRGPQPSPPSPVPHSVTPQGVEHIEKYGAGTRYVQVPESVPPQGVEHNGRYHVEKVELDVSNAVTPQGVEHQPDGMTYGSVAAGMRCGIHRRRKALSSVYGCT